MSQQIQAVKNTQSRLTKAGIVHPAVQKEQEKAKGGVFLGPQLPIPWGEDLLKGITLFVVILIVILNYFDSVVNQLVIH